MSLAASTAAMPNAWAMAAEAVTRDLAHLYEAPTGTVRVVDADDVDWYWEHTFEDCIAIGMSGPDAFAIGRGYCLDDGAAEATVHLADAVQTDLAGYRFTLWPVYGHVGKASVRTLTPELRDGAAVWVTRDGDVYAEIGSLAPTTSSP
ncbi:hypothetical protein [Gordonia phthalatica]|uniref:Uncharacterized protein n=1 Tax=Gordonia phthalatica TaxID=1136941 RepID=A0A0N9NHU2_9ACTN|nr:hypothetical protein [Gordonia phthalatica]ALG85398.1 hypothetical protein ACH46_14075 [Gordonia phthalatica]